MPSLVKHVLPEAFTQGNHDCGREEIGNFVGVLPLPFLNISSVLVFDSLNMFLIYFLFICKDCAFKFDHDF